VKFSLQWEGSVHSSTRFRAGIVAPAFSLVEGLWSVRNKRRQSITKIEITLTKEMGNPWHTLLLLMVRELTLLRKDCSHEYRVQIVFPKFI
jgi:hypothetical protein